MPRFTRYSRAIHGCSCCHGFARPVEDYPWIAPRGPAASIRETPRGYGWSDQPAMGGRVCSYVRDLALGRRALKVWRFKRDRMVIEREDAHEPWSYYSVECSAHRRGY